MRRSFFETLNVCEDYFGVIAVALGLRVVGKNNGVMRVCTCGQSKIMAFEVLGVPKCESLLRRLGFCKGGGTLDHMIDFVVQFSETTNKGRATA